jgi:hypothetical protein
VIRYQDEHGTGCWGFGGEIASALGGGIMGSIASGTSAGLSAKPPLVDRTRTEPRSYAPDATAKGVAAGGGIEVTESGNSRLETDELGVGLGMFWDGPGRSARTPLVPLGSRLLRTIARADRLIARARAAGQNHDQTTLTPLLERLARLRATAYAQAYAP